ncbi:UDP-glycosyltransferase 71B5 isoform X2 [Eutrema salsugineum]|uniref:UDP-glycosyltransferase 71B5 isoform X2 n=1 Tax=Eutrema salsugineum TaxID=72664 RepID=UPI000CED604F|nr:UDP-glycosyltransferase 71B5 isoform X2 [Eutrema salsugineum]
MAFELVFIPSPGIGHLRSTVELAKQLVNSNDLLSITIIIIPHSSGKDAGSDSIASLFTAARDRLRYITISVAEKQTGDSLPAQFYIKNQIPQVREAVAKLLDGSPSSRLAGFVVDMFCTSMVDLANEFGVPSYMVYTSNATFLGITLHLQSMLDEEKYDVSELDDSVSELEFPCLTRPYPVKCLPYIFASKQWLPFFLDQARNFRKMKEGECVPDCGGAGIGGGDKEVL